MEIVLWGAFAIIFVVVGYYWSKHLRNDLLAKWNQAAGRLGGKATTPSGGVTVTLTANLGGVATAVISPPSLGPFR